LSKKDRIKASKKKQAHSLNKIDEEDNKVTELVLKGINVLMLKGKEDSTLQKIIKDQTDMLFKLSHHKVFRI
jgi:flagellar hook-length control protein FliK